MPAARDRSLGVGNFRDWAGAGMAERQEQWHFLPLAGKTKNHPGKDACQKLLRSQSQKRSERRGRGAFPHFGP